MRSDHTEINKKIQELIKNLRKIQGAVRLLVLSIENEKNSSRFSLPVVRELALLKAVGDWQIRIIQGTLDTLRNIHLDEAEYIDEKEYEFAYDSAIKIVKKIMEDLQLSGSAETLHKTQTLQKMEDEKHTPMIEDDSDDEDEEDNEIEKLEICLEEVEATLEKINKAIMAEDTSREAIVILVEMEARGKLLADMLTKTLEQLCKHPEQDHSLAIEVTRKMIKHSKFPELNAVSDKINEITAEPPSSRKTNKSG